MADRRADLNDSALSVLEQIQSTLQNVQSDYQTLARTIGTINGRVNDLLRLQESPNETEPVVYASTGILASEAPEKQEAIGSDHVPTGRDAAESSSEPGTKPINDHRAITTSRIILTTYPGQAGIDPLVMNWGHPDPAQRGPVVVSRSRSTIRHRNGEFVPLR